MRDFRPDVAGEIAAAWRDAAAWNDVAFAEYISRLRYPPHLRRMVGFARAHIPGACGVLLPRGHAKTTVAIRMVARLVGERRGRVKVLIATATEADALKRSAAVRHIVASARFADVFGWARGRAKALDRYMAVIDPMLTPDATVLFLGTRWHEDDLYRALSDRGIPFFTEGAIGDDGSALWPERWPLEKLLAKREAMGSALFNLQYQNDPSGLGGNVVRREWFHYVDRLPEPGRRRVDVDLNAGASERSDYTAAVEWWEDPDRNLYLAGAWRERLSEGHRAWLTGRTDATQAGAPPEFGRPDGPRLLWPGSLLPEGFAGLAGAPLPFPRGIVALNIEATQHQSTFVREMLARTNLPARAIFPDRDKVTRARTLAARYEAGKVFHLRGAPGLATYEAELVAFPNGEHDDLVDAAVYGADLGGNEFYFTSANR